MAKLLLREQTGKPTSMYRPVKSFKTALTSREDCQVEQLENAKCGKDPDNFDVWAATRLVLPDNTLFEFDISRSCSVFNHQIASGRFDPARE